MKVCIIGAPGKLGAHMVRHAPEHGWDVVGVYRSQSVEKLAEFEGKMTVVPGPTNDWVRYLEAWREEGKLRGLKVTRRRIERLTAG